MRSQKEEKNNYLVTQSKDTESFHHVARVPSLCFLYIILRLFWFLCTYFITSITQPTSLRPILAITCSCWQQPQGADERSASRPRIQRPCNAPALPRQQESGAVCNAPSSRRPSPGSQIAPSALPVVLRIRNAAGGNSTAARQEGLYGWG